MSKKFLTDIDLRQNEILNPSLHRTSGVPTASPTQSQFHFDTDDEKLKYYGDNKWRVPAVEINDLEDVDTNTTTPSSGDRLVFDGTNWIPQSGSFTSDELLDITQTSAQTISTSGGVSPTTYNDINWGTQIIVGNKYTNTTGGTSSQIVFNEDGIYEVTYSISLDVTNNSRTIANTIIVLDNGGGFNEINRSKSYTYHRTGAAGEGTANKTVKLNLTSGDIIKLQSRRQSGSGNLITIPDGCNITITKLT